MPCLSARRAAWQVLIAQDLLRIHKPVRPLVSAVVTFRKWVVVAACTLLEGLPAEFISFRFGNRVVVAHGRYPPVAINRASRQAITKAGLDASTGIRCETAATQRSLAWA